LSREKIQIQLIRKNYEDNALITHTEVTAASQQITNFSLITVNCTVVKEFVTLCRPSPHSDTLCNADRCSSVELLGEACRSVARPPVIAVSSQLIDPSATSQ